MKNQHYLAFTIGPILRTISKARKTRELWASSYIFSLFMYKLLIELKDYEVLLPHVDGNALPNKNNHSYKGAGIWPDRCFVRISDKELPDVNEIISGASSAVAEALNTRADLRPLIRVYPLSADWKKGSVQEGAINNDNDTIIIHRLNRLLDNLELSAPYQGIEKQSLNTFFELNKHIHSLYRTAAHTDSSVFVTLNDNSIRLPSIPEIALKEIKNSSDPNIRNAYNEEVETPINEKILRIRQIQGERAKDLETDEENEKYYQKLKQHLNFRHKYIATIVADGDNLGKMLSQIDEDEEKLSAFSKQLMAFSKKAVDKILDYGALPVYAGGDDLLFLAPVTNKTAPESHNIFELCHKLNQTFKDCMQAENLSLSFGVMISYHKFPLGEAVQAAHKLEQQAKQLKIWHTEDMNLDGGEQKPRYAKQAICFRIHKHSGQQFGANLWMGGKSINEVLKLLKDYDSNPDQAFLASLIHKLQALPELLAEANANGQLTFFKDNHFDEGGKHDGQFIKNVFDLIPGIFEDYGDKLDQGLEEKMKEDPRFKDRAANKLHLYHANILFAVLRLKQFLIQPYHD